MLHRSSREERTGWAADGASVMAAVSGWCDRDESAGAGAATLRSLKLAWSTCVDSSLGVAAEVAVASAVAVAVLNDDVL